MKRVKWFFLTPASLIAMAFLSPSGPVFAEETIADLKKQIETLRAEVADLKASRNGAERFPAAAAADYGAPVFWDPFAEMQQMQDRMNRLFRESFSRSHLPIGRAVLDAGTFYEPDLDIQDQKDHYKMTLDLPGMEKDQIDIKVTDHEIVVSGQRNFQSERHDDRQGFYRVERRFGSFSRRFPLPEDAASEGVSADYKDGVLEIKIPKKAPSASKVQARHIKVT